MNKYKVSSIILTGVLLGNVVPSAYVEQHNTVFAAETTKAFDRATLKVGERVSVKGTVVSEVNVWGGNSFYIELENGQGVFVYPKKDLAIKKGNVVEFTAKVEKYKGQYQLTELENYKLISATGNVEAKAKDISALTTLEEGTYIGFDNVTVSKLKKIGNYNNTSFTVTDKNGKSINVYIDSRSGADYNNVAAKISDGAVISIKGIFASAEKGVELKPYTLNDIVVNSTGEVQEAKSVSNIGEIQGEGYSSALQGKRVKVENVVVTKVDTKGFYIQDINPDNNPKTSDAIYVVSSEKVSSGDKLTVEGRVDEGYGDGYAGKEATDLTITQLTDVKITKNGTANLPTPIDIFKNIPRNIIENDGFAKFDPEEDALDYWESIEGMLVKVQKPKVLGPQLYGEIYVLPKDYNEKELNNAGGLSLEPDKHNTEIIPILVGDRKYRAKAKDYFDEDIEGVVTYSFGGFKVLALKMPKIIDGGLEREKSQLTPAEDKLTIASYNIENFSANNAKKETPDSKVEKIAKSFINEINNPDIITLIEVQDNNGGVDDGTVDGTKSGQRLADKIKELGGVEYKYTEVAPLNNVDGGKPGANIRVAFLYNPNRVKLVGENPGGSTESAKFVNGHLEKNPSRIEPTNPAFDSVRKSLAAEFEFKGENIVVIANHLKSKRGDDSLYGKKQPAVETSQPGRIEQAEILNNFVKEGLKQNPNLKFVLTGDFNDYEFSKTIKAAEGNELVSLLTNHDKKDRYSYFYRGNNQSLDNILVSKNILAKSVFDAVHVNSSFMEEDGRASDHDPLVVQIDFSKEDNNNNNDGNGGNDGNNDGDKGNGRDTGGNDSGKDDDKDKGGNHEITHKENEGDRDSSADKGSDTSKKYLAKTGLTTNISVLGIGMLILGMVLLRRKVK